jgi:purine-binding chemotaxis protein CheW
MATTDIDKKTSYINLQIGSESFAVSVFNVLEIIQFEQLTWVPNASVFVPGVINFRGSIVPLIDMHKRFGMEQPEQSGRMVVVVEVRNKDKNVMMGLLVDHVSDVIEFEYRNIKSVPEMGIRFNPEYLEGFIEQEDKFIMVLNIDRVLNIQELADISHALPEKYVIN